MQHGRFLFLFLGICVVGYAVLIGIGRSPLYCHFTHNSSDVAPCFKAGTTGSDADVLLVGDSSLLYGIRPDLVAAKGGGSVYNLGMLGPNFSNQVTALIDGYLAANKRPRAIVLYFSPWETISHDRLVDQVWWPLGVYLLGHGSWGEIAHFLTIRPSVLVETPPLIVAGLTSSGPRLDSFAPQVQASRGYIEYLGSGRMLSADCQPASLQPAHNPLGDNRAALARLRARYRAQGIAVFVYVAPTAICDNAIDAIRRTYQGISDNLPEALPNEDFADDTREAGHVHASPVGVPAFSDLLAKFLRTTVQPRLTAP